MVKVRFNALDVAACVNSLRVELRGMRLNNIYDIDNKVLVFFLFFFSQKTKKKKKKKKDVLAQVL